VTRFAGSRSEEMLVELVRAEENDGRPGGRGRSTER
jgi:hypothetical protein